MFAFSTGSRAEGLFPVSALRTPTGLTGACPALPSPMPPLQRDNARAAPQASLPCPHPCPRPHLLVTGTACPWGTGLWLPSPPGPSQRVAPRPWRSVLRLPFVLLPYPADRRVSQMCGQEAIHLSWLGWAVTDACTGSEQLGTPTGHRF